MPFLSKSQRRWMYANHPDMAKKWEKDTPKNAKLPEKKKKKRKKSKWEGGPYMDFTGPMQVNLPKFDDEVNQSSVPPEVWKMIMQQEERLKQQELNEGSLQDSISKGFISTPEGYDSAQAAYDHFQAPPPPVQQTKPFNPLMARASMKAGLTAMDWIAGITDRNRQNQYMANQYSTLGQRNAMPASDYQPNPFSLYSKYGGSIRKYTKKK